MLDDILKEALKPAAIGELKDKLDSKFKQIGELEMKYDLLSDAEKIALSNLILEAQALYNNIESATLNEAQVQDEQPAKEGENSDPFCISQQEEATPTETKEHNDMDLICSHCRNFRPREAKHIVTDEQSVLGG